MKRIALTVATAALTWFGAASTASARPHHHGGGYAPTTFVSSYGRCGCAVYQQRYVAFYDGYGRPVWRVRTMPVSHRCRPAVVSMPVYRPVCPPYRPPICRPSYAGPRVRANVVLQTAWNVR